MDQQNSTIQLINIKIMKEEDFGIIGVYELTSKVEWFIDNYNYNQVELVCLNRNRKTKKNSWSNINSKKTVGKQS